MDKDQTARYIITMLAIITLILSITWLRHAHEIIVPFLVSLFIAIVASSPVEWLQTKNVSKSIAVLLVLVMIIVGLLMISLLLGQSIEQFSNELPLYKTQLKDMMRGLLDWLASIGIPLSKDAIFNAFDPSTVLAYVETFIGGLGTVLSKMILILLTVTFMLVDGSRISKQIEWAYGERGQKILQVMSKAARTTRAYMALKTLMSLLMAVLIGIALMVIGLKYAVMWSVLVFLLNFVPNIGLFLAMIPALLFSLLQLGAAKTVLVLIAYLVVNSFVDLFVQARFVGEQMGLSMLVIFLSLIFWGWVLGPVGMILSVPLTMVVKYSVLAFNDEL